VAPEQARDAGAVDGRADVYSLGCTLYHLLTGRPPFPGGTGIEKVARHLTEQVPAQDTAALGLPAGLAEVVARMTARAPEQRYQTAGEAAAALAPFASPGSTPREAVRAAAPVAATAFEREAAPRPDATVVAPPPRGPRGRSRVRWGWMAAFAMFFGLVAVPGVVVYRILTDKGELVIETVDDDVEVVVKQGGKVVTLYDPKTKQKLVLCSGSYELELKGKPAGLKLDLDRVTLKRGDKEIAKIVRVPPPPPVPEPPPGQPPAIRPPGGPVAWWRADGNAKDSAGGNHGTLKGGVTFAPGVAGQAFDFNDTDAYVQVPNNANLNPGASFSVEFWVKANPIQPEALFDVLDKSHDDAPHAGWAFQGATATGELSFLIGAGGGITGASTGVSILDNQWHHIAGVYTGNSIQMYLDGVLKSMNPLTAPPSNNTRDLYFARKVLYVTRSYEGLLDEVAIYDRALSPAEVKARWSALASATKPVAEKVGQLTPEQAASKYLILPIDKVASAVSTKSLFAGGDIERLLFPTWGKQEVFGIPFDVIDPKGDSVKNAIVLYGPLGAPAREMPTAVRLKCGAPAKAIHLLSGISGWGWGCTTADNQKTVSMIVRLHYQDGRDEEHELINGVHFSDYNCQGNRRLVDVPGSKPAAIRLLEPAPGALTQIRYLAIQPKNPSKVIEEIEFIKGMKGDVTAPVIMAVTVERPAAEKVGEVRRFEAHTKGVAGVAISPDGRYALSGGSDGTCVLWEVATGREVRRFSGHNGPVDGIAFSPDGRQALTARYGGTVQLWDVETGKEIRVLKGHPDDAYRVAFSPDGRHALSGGDETMRLWDLESGKELGRFTGGVGVAFSPDGRQALSGGHSAPLVGLWDVETGAGLRELRGHTGSVTGVVFLPGGRQGLSCSHDRTLRLWDLDSGKEVRCFSGHTSPVQNVAITPDGKFGLSGSADKTVRLWDLQTGKELHCFTGHTGGVLGVTVSPDGKFGLSGSEDDTVRLWRLPDPPPAKEKP
jgi:WD40 repeat protein